MKVLGTAAIALALLASGSAFAHDDDGYRRHGHDRGYGRHHERYYGDYGRHERRYYGGYYRPEVGYYTAPVYVAPPPPVIYGTYSYAYPQPRDGVTVILPPIRIGF